MSNKYERVSFAESVREKTAGLMVLARMDYTLLLREYLEAMVFSKKDMPIRDVYNDAVRYLRGVKIESKGSDNFPTTRGALIVFNHPLGDVLFPGMFEVVRLLKEETGRDLKVIAGTSSVTRGEFGKRITPWVNRQTDRFYSMFPNNVINVANGNRLGARLETIKTVIGFQELVALAPSGTVDGRSKPRRGAGNIGKQVSQEQLPIIPVGLWKDKKIIHVTIGTGFDVSNLSDQLAADKMFEKIGELLPEKQRTVLLSVLGT